MGAIYALRRMHRPRASPPVLDSGALTEEGGKDGLHVAVPERVGTIFLLETGTTVNHQLLEG